VIAGGSTYSCSSSPIAGVESGWDLAGVCSSNSLVGLGLGYYTVTLDFGCCLNGLYGRWVNFIAISGIAISSSLNQV
jgi:hypothetical protein